MIDIRNTDYIDAREIERIIQDHWYNMFVVCDCGGSNVGVFLDLTDDHLELLEDDLACYKNDKRSATFVKNEITLIKALREAGYAGQSLLLLINC